MYDVFDSYLDADTWHTNHPLDEQRFLRSLGKVVRDTNFNPDDMGSYMLSNKGLNRNNQDDAVLVSVINKRVVQAWVIQEFLELGV